MKTKHLYAAGFALITGTSACSSNGTQGTTSPGDSSVTTTTTTITTHHKYGGKFVPRPSTKYIDLKTNKEVSVRIDTTLGSIVNDETNEPMDLFVEPITHDTIYGLTGTVVNNYVIHEPGGDLHVDTLKIPPMEAQHATEPADDHTGKEKYKQNESGTKTKYKDEDVKVKEKNGVIKTKDR